MNKIADGIWWTRKARIKTEKRLLANAFQAQLLLVWYSFCSVAISIYYLKFATENDYAGISWVVFSVLVLCISGFINGLNYKERASLIKECYETLHNLYQQAVVSTDQTEIATKYEQVLNMCENHEEIDYYYALCEAHLTQPTPKESLTKHPTRFIWFKVGGHLVRRWSYLFLFYLLPIVIFVLIGLSNDC